MKRKLWVIPIILFGLWFTLKDITYRQIMANKDYPDTEAASYVGEEGWIVLPIEPPPGAWTEPWGIDLFIIPPPTGASAGRSNVGISDKLLAENMTKNARTVEKAFAPSGPSYSALYRHPSAAKATTSEDWDISRGDLAMAFERYLYSKNNSRGILLIASPNTAHLTGPIIQRIKSDPQLIERFSGIVHFDEEDAAYVSGVQCSMAMAGDCVIKAEAEYSSSLISWIMPRLYLSSLTFEISEQPALTQLLVERNTRLSLWLDKNAAKPAEPLGGLDSIEVIEIAPIRRPGETDDVIAERELRGN